ncbi:MAG: hypothetical protein WCH09_00850 [Bacteroidota bacterium]
MNLNGLFGWLDYIIYLVQSSNRHGVHSPFVYDFADKVLYRQFVNSYEPAAELCRKRMLQSDAKILLNSELKEISLSDVANNRIPLAKYYRLLFRWIQYKQLGGNIIEIGSSLGVLPLYLQRGNIHYEHDLIQRFFSYDRSKKINEITQFNLRSYENNELVISHPFTEVTEIVKHFNHHSIPNSPISLLVINDALSNSEFWSIIEFASPRLESNGFIAIFGINNSEESRLRWKQLENDDNFRVTIDLFGMGLVFARKEQIKEAFLLRY